MTKLTPSRPTHTGSARKDTSKATKVQHRRPPAYLITERAAIALNQESQDAPQASTRRQAKRPLAIGRGRTGIALRQIEGGPIEICIRSTDGQFYWREARKVIRQDLLNSWAKNGF